MRRALILPALLLTLAGCSSAAEAPTAGKASAPPSDPDRAACHAVSEVNTAKQHLDPARTASAAQLAMQAQAQQIRKAAGTVQEASTAVATTAKPAEKTSLAQAWLDLSGACGTLYGPGPW